MQSTCNDSISKASVKKQKEINFFQINTVESKITNDSLEKAPADDLINVDEDSTSLEVSIHSSEQNEISNSSISRLQIDQTNNNIHETDNSTFNVAPSSGKNDVNLKISEPNKESEIDVCSLEEDEVLELDVPKKRNEIVEIVSSSSESDIEVCDYEPPCKRKTYNILMRPARL